MQYTESCSKGSLAPLPHGVERLVAFRALLLHVGEITSLLVEPPRNHRRKGRELTLIFELREPFPVTFVRSSAGHGLVKLDVSAVLNQLSCILKRAMRAVHNA